MLLLLLRVSQGHIGYAPQVIFQPVVQHHAHICEPAQEIAQHLKVDGLGLAVIEIGKLIPLPAVQLEELGTA